MPDDRLTPIERELEAVLSGLHIRPAGVSRDAVMFDAGRASARRRNRLWQGASSVLALLLLVSVLSRSDDGISQPPPEAVAQQPPVPASRAVAIDPVDAERARVFREYIRTRRAVIDRGVEAIEAPSEPRERFAPPLTRESLDELLSST